jgi:hypothetical protein
VDWSGQFCVLIKFILFFPFFKSRIKKREVPGQIWLGKKGIFGRKKLGMINAIQEIV